MKKIVLKISGEALKDNDNVVSEEKLEIIYKSISILSKNNLVAIVIGGGNYFRGREHLEMEDLNRDTIGMLATCINALYIKDFLEKKGLVVNISTPFTFPSLIPNYSLEELQNNYDKGNIIIFGGGIGKSGVSTDAAAGLAIEMLQANLIIKMTNVDGVFDKDPKKYHDAKMFSKLTYKDIISNNYQVMDKVAIEKCAQNNTSLLVMNFNKYYLLEDYLQGKNIGTIVGDEI